MQKKLQLMMAILPSVLTYACNLQYAINVADTMNDDLVMPHFSAESGQTDVSLIYTMGQSMQLIARMESKDDTEAYIYAESNNKKKRKSLLNAWLCNQKDYLTQHNIWICPRYQYIILFGHNLYTILEILEKNKKLFLEMAPLTALEPYTWNTLDQTLNGSEQTLGGENYKFSLHSMDRNAKEMFYIVHNLTQQKDMVVKILRPYNKAYTKVEQIINIGGHRHTVHYYGVYDLMGFKCIVME